VLVSSRSQSELFERAVAGGAPADKAANWITQDLAALQKDHEDGRVGPEHLVELIRLVDDGTISGTGAKQALEEAFTSGDPIDAIVERRGLRQVSDTTELGGAVDDAIAANPDVVEKFRAGNPGVLGFLVGQVMKATGGAANPKVVQELLRERLG
jgi:Asp-tRNA(Asn)/Glu-tRNA(Gln) amidotransferase B subunit